MIFTVCAKDSRKFIILSCPCPFNTRRHVPNYSPVRLN